MSRPSPVRSAARPSRRALLMLPALLLSLAAALTTAAAPAPPANPAGPAAKGTGAKMSSLPRYVPPPSYSEDLVIQTEGRTLTLTRHLDKGMSRTEFSADGHDAVMIELGDEKGTSYEIMPEQKMALKQSRQAMEAAGGEAMRKEMEKPAPKGSDSPSTDVKVEDLGDDAVGDQAAKKFRLTFADGGVVAWFDKGTGAPLRMEGMVDGRNAVIEWKNRVVGPQAASLFEVPKGYELHDMDAIMAQTKGMGGMAGMGGMMKGMLGGMTQGMGSNLGAGLGSKLGGSLAGPLGAVAGQYIGGRIGSLLGRKAADAVH